MPASRVAPERALVTLQRLLEIPGADLTSALVHASNALAEAFEADKVDAFLYDETRDCLVAEGTSTQPLSNLQKNLGLDVLPLSNGGRMVEVYQTGKLFRSGNVLADKNELRGVREGLKVQSMLGVPLPIGDKRRGALLITSLQADFFTEADEAFVTSAAAWVGMVAHRAELLEAVSRNAVEQGRHAAAEELVTVLAHDVRNYLAPISGRLYLLRQHAEQQADAKAIEHAAMALRGVTGLSKLVASLLDVARIDRGLFQLDLEPLDLAEVANEAAGTLSRADHEVLVRVSSPAVVAGDRARLRQCLDNLLSNALGHSPPGAPVNVFIQQLTLEGARWASLEVVDAGPGIPEDILPRVFERFVSGRSSSGGVGLGLYLANRIAQAHGGRMEVESAVGKGSRFKMLLPLYQAAGTPGS